MRHGWNWILASVYCAMLAACASGTGGGGADGQGTLANGGQTATQRAAFGGEASLPAYHWQLQDVSGPDRQWFAAGRDALKKPVQLTFADQRLGVAGLCNGAGGGYRIEGERITIESPVRTMMACLDDRLMKLESQLLTQLPQVQTWRLQGTEQEPRLQLHFANGSEWTLQGVPTDETLYGSAPELLFLEVAPQTRPCSAGTHPQQCLEVRRVEFDDSGRRTAAGPWELFYEQIRGFTHEPGMRHVLRIKRYTRADPPADASRYVHVLDMTVSSSLER